MPSLRAGRQEEAVRATLCPACRPQLNFVDAPDRRRGRSGREDRSVDLPFAEGQHVRIIVAERDAGPVQRLPIAEVRRQLKGGVERFDDPFEPMIPGGDWEMFK
jgi:hypothetical protein